MEGCFIEVCDQWCTTGLLVFLKHVINLDVNVGDMVREFADVRKVCDIVDGEEGWVRLQKDVDQMEYWAGYWQTEFNPNKFPSEQSELST